MIGNRIEIELTYDLTQGIPRIRRGSAARALFATLVVFTSAIAAPAQPLSCDAYARAYADNHINPDAAGLATVNEAMRGAIAGGAWGGPSGASRGAAAGGALAVFDALGNTPAGWQALYDAAYGMCRSSQSPVAHRPHTLGDPSYHPAENTRPRIAPQQHPMPAQPFPQAR